MAEYDYDFFVIGAGSGGVRAARMAALYGARVGVAEEYKPGGTCVLRGCIPKKFLVIAGHYADAFREAPSYGWDLDEPGFDWPRLIASKDRELERLSGIYQRNLEKAGAELIPERAELVGPHEILLKSSGRRVSAKYILVAVGGWPNLDPSLPGVEHVITSNEALELPGLPKSIIIAGGGYIAVEFANIFHRLGVETTLIYRGEKILRGFDEDLRDGLMAEMKKAGIRFVLSDVFTRIEKQPDGSLVGHTRKGNALQAEQVMFAIGRSPNTRGLGLEAAGVELDGKGAIRVDEFSRSSVEHIFAVGDVTDRIALTPVAIREGAAVAETLFNDNPTRADHANVPSAVFSTPEIGTVGLTEEAACATYPEVDVYLARFRNLKHTLTGMDEQTLMKMIVEARSGRVLGVHIMGEAAAEMIQFAGIAVKKGLTKADFDATVAVHPSAAEEMVTMKAPARQHRSEKAAAS